MRKAAASRLPEQLHEEKLWVKEKMIFGITLSD